MITVTDNSFSYWFSLEFYRQHFLVLYNSSFLHIKMERWMLILYLGFQQLVNRNIHLKFYTSFKLCSTKEACPWLFGPVTSSNKQDRDDRTVEKVFDNKNNKPQDKKKKHVPRNLLSACYLLLAAVKHSNGGYCFQSRDGFLFWQRVL